MPTCQLRSELGKEGQLLKFKFKKKWRRQVYKHIPFVHYNFILSILRGALPLNGLLLLEVILLISFQSWLAIFSAACSALLICSICHWSIQTVMCNGERLISPNELWVPLSHCWKSTCSPQRSNMEGPILPTTATMPLWSSGGASAYPHAHSVSWWDFLQFEMSLSATS